MRTTTSTSTGAGAEEASLDAVRLSWTNPTLTVDGSDLTSITSVTIRRNFEEIAVLTDAQVGADMEYEDNGLEPGLYEYAIHVTNEAGISRTTYRNVLVGEKCSVVFQLHDDGDDGWKGAAISVTSENGQRIAIITMTEGSDCAVTSTSSGTTAGIMPIQNTTQTENAPSPSSIMLATNFSPAANSKTVSS